MQHTYGWHPDPLDLNDHIYLAKKPGILASLNPLTAASRWSLPGKHDLSAMMPPILNQGRLNSCVGVGLSNIVRYERTSLHLPDFLPSALFIYYFARRLRGWEKIDGGCIIRDAMKVLVADGVPRDEEWHYDEEMVDARPPQDVLHRALTHKTSEYLSLPRDLYRMKRCINEGHPFGFGFSVYESFESDNVANTGLVPMPLRGEKMLGGHFSTACGFDDSTERVKCANSWGQRWGEFGYFYLPYEFFLDDNLSDDFWTLRLVS